MKSWNTKHNTPSNNSDWRGEEGRKGGGEVGRKGGREEGGGKGRHTVEDEGEREKRKWRGI